MILGHISLNLSFLIYLFLYLPQVIHNHRQASLAGLSIHLHNILYTAYCFDLVYGIGTDLPWQYLLVSSVGLVLLTVQHAQFIHYFKQNRCLLQHRLFYLMSICLSAILIYTIYQPSWLRDHLDLCGYLAQIGFSIALIPQILKSYRMKSVQAVHILFIQLNALLNLLDCISAWQLSWGWPNKLGAVCGLMLTSILILQYYLFDPNRRSISY